MNLQPSTNNTYEIGSKTRIGNGILTAALFRTDTDNEIVVDESKDGRTTYKNAGKRAVRVWKLRSTSSLPRTGS